jgi:hypothetical protein
VDGKVVATTLAIPARDVRFVWGRYIPEDGAFGCLRVSVWVLGSC